MWPPYQLDIKYKIILVDAGRELMKNGKCGFCQAGSRYFTNLKISCHTYHRKTPYKMSIVLTISFTIKRRLFARKE
jgi:hypothetical protein